MYLHAYLVLSSSSSSRLQGHQLYVLENQTPYTNVEVTVPYWGSPAVATYSFRSMSAGWFVLLVVCTDGRVYVCV